MNNHTDRPLTLRLKIPGSGGDSGRAKPASDGGDGELIPPPHKHHKHDVCPQDLLSLNIPWKECDIEGEIDLRLRFKREAGHVEDKDCD